MTTPDQQTPPAIDRNHTKELSQGDSGDDTAEHLPDASESLSACSCGSPIDPETAALADMFPGCVRPGLCDQCLDAEAKADRRARSEQERKREATRRVARLAAIPPEMLRTSIDHPQFNAGLWVRVENWQPSRDRWLGLIGGAGACKTRSLALIAKRLILAGHHLTWTTATEFQDRVDDLRGDREEAREAKTYLRRCRTTGILVLDDLGKNTWTPAVERHLFGVIDHRKTHDLAVLWSANTPPLAILASNQLTKDRGAPLIGRILEASKIEKA